MQIGDYIIKKEVLRSDSASKYYLCHLKDNEKALFTCKIIDKTQLTSHEMIKLNDFLNNYSDDAYDVFTDHSLVYIIQKVENCGLSIAQILDFRGYFEEDEVRVILAKVSYVIRVLYNHNSFPRSFDIQNIFIHLNEDDFYVATQSSPLKSKRIMKLKFQNLDFARSDAIISIYINDIVYPENRINQSHQNTIHLTQNYNQDIQTLGVLYFELLTGINPLEYLNTLQSGQNPKIRYNSNTQNINVSANGLRFMKKSVRFDIAKHKSMTKIIMNHKFLRDDIENQECSKISFSDLLNLFAKYYKIGRREEVIDLHSSYYDIPLQNSGRSFEKKVEQDELFNFSTANEEEEEDCQQVQFETTEYDEKQEEDKSEEDKAQQSFVKIQDKEQHPNLFYWLKFFTRYILYLQLSDKLFIRLLEHQFQQILKMINVINGEAHRQLITKYAQERQPPKVTVINYKVPMKFEKYYCLRQTYSKNWSKDYLPLTLTDDQKVYYRLLNSKDQYLLPEQLNI